MSTVFFKLENSVVDSNMVKEVTIQPGATDNNMAKSPIESMSYEERRDLATGSSVEVVVHNTVTGTQHSIGPMPRKLVLETFTQVKTHLDQLEVQGHNISGVERIIIPLSSHEAFEEINRFLKFSIKEANGALGDMKALPKDGNSLNKSVRVCEAAIAVSFKDVVNQMKVRINRTMYHGTGHKYRTPIESAWKLWESATMSSTKYENEVKAKLVWSITQAWLDGNLLQNKEVEALMARVSTFGDDVNNETERLSSIRK